MLGLPRDDGCMGVYGMMEPRILFEQVRLVLPHARHAIHLQEIGKNSL